MTLMTIPGGLPQCQSLHKPCIEQPRTPHDRDSPGSKIIILITVGAAAETCYSSQIRHEEKHAPTLRRAAEFVIDAGLVAAAVISLAAILWIVMQLP
jgi:hypothetical protein